VRLDALPRGFQRRRSFYAHGLTCRTTSSLAGCAFYPTGVVSTTCRAKVAGEAHHANGAPFGFSVQPARRQSMAHPWRGLRPPSLPPTCVVARRGRNRRSRLLHRRPCELPRGGFVEKTMARQRDGEGWGREEKTKRGLPHMHATSSRVTGLDTFGPAVRPEQLLGTSVTHFMSSWTDMTQQHKFEDR
jgi:hypothetical protein